MLCKCGVVLYKLQVSICHFVYRVVCMCGVVVYITHVLRADRLLTLVFEVNCLHIRLDLEGLPI